MPLPPRAETADQTIPRYLEESCASKVDLLVPLRALIATTPPGDFRTGLEAHLHETFEHVRRLRRRLGELDTGDPLPPGAGATALPWEPRPDATREEQLLRNAMNTCCAEVLEIVTCTAIERAARSAGDTATARLVAWIRRDEERMLACALLEVPRLSDIAAARARGEAPDGGDGDAAGAKGAGVIALGGAAGEPPRSAKRSLRAAR